MPIVGFVETKLHAGTINTSETFTKEHNFPKTGLTVWARPYLQQVSVNDDDGSVILSISRYADQDGPHSGSWTPGIFVEGCTSITFKMRTRDCVATAVLTSEIFG
jgi:hypothetical protein